MAKLSDNEKKAAALGMTVKAYNDSKKASSTTRGSAPSGYVGIPNSNKIMTSDADNAMAKLSAEARAYVLKQNFGNELTSGEVNSFNSKWIDANKKNSSSSLANTTVGNLPQEAFNITVPQLIPGTPEYQAAVDNLSTAYFDVIQQQLNASTEQEKSVADYNWNTLKTGIEKNLNISLSNDAYQAWNQLQGLKSQYANQNIENSGIQNETMDNYLAGVRRADSINREDALTKSKAGEIDYYTKFATPEQIKALIDSDPAKAQSFGLIPSAETKNSLNFAAMKEKYPNMSDDEINKSISTVLDTNGNYRSALYQKYMTGGNVGVNLGAVDTGNIVKDQYGNNIAIPVKPTDTGYLDVQAAKNQYQNLNAPLSNLMTDYNSRVSLGSLQPTSGTDSGTAYGTQFNKVTPTTNTTPMIPNSL